MDWKPINRMKYRVMGSCVLLHDITRKTDLVQLVNTVIWIFCGVCIGILGCYMLIN